MGWLKNILIAVDEVGNAATGGAPHETISSRAGRAQAKGAWWACQLCRFLDLFEQDHCRQAMEKEESTKQAASD